MGEEGEKGVTSPDLSKGFSSHRQLGESEKQTHPLTFKQLNNNVEIFSCSSSLFHRCVGLTCPQLGVEASWPGSDVGCANTPRSLAEKPEDVCNSSWHTGILGPEDATLGKHLIGDH